MKSHEKMMIENLISKIRPADRAVYLESRRQWDSLAKPLGSLGVLEDDISRIAAITGKADVVLENRQLLVFCADNGVIRRGVSQTDESATTAVAAALGRGDSTASFMAEKAGCGITAIDIGMKNDTPDGVLDRKIRRGTDDISSGRAMSREECERAVLAGVRAAEEAVSAGADILLLGEMGIGNTTTSAAVVCAALGILPEKAAGRGAGLSDDGLKRKIHAIEQALSVNDPDPEDPIDIISKVGGFDIAALCGACLGGAALGIPVILDGLITNVAAFMAVELCPAARDALIASHVSKEAAAGIVLGKLGLKPCISAGLHLGEGTGALLSLSLLDQALAVYQSGHTFGKLGIDAYKPQ